MVVVIINMVTMVMMIVVNEYYAPTPESGLHKSEL